MPSGRGPSTFKQRDLTAALKSARAAGVILARIEVDKTGRIILIPDHPETEHNPNVVDDWEDAR